MNSFPKSKSQQVIPRWLTYDDSVNTGELFIPHNAPLPTDPTFEEDFAIFQTTPSPLLASDLLGRALLQNREGKKSLAEYLINSPQIREPTRQLALRVLGAARATPPIESLQRQVSSLRNQLRLQPRNAVRWIDMARLYTILNQPSKAKESIRTALSIAPSDRFCLRSAARCLLHFHEPDAADQLFRRNSAFRKDPWLLATSAAVAQIAQKPSPLPRRFFPPPLEPQQLFHHSELLETVGMHELENGHDRSSRRLFREAWRVPSINVVTHAEWLTRTRIQGLRSDAGFNPERSTAARSFVRLSHGDVDGALCAAEEWILEEPYSRSPVVQASYLASVKEDYARVIRYYDDAMQRGCSDNTLCNNAAFAMIQLGQMAKAHDIISQLISTKDVDFALLATAGLYEMKAGRIQDGLQLYDKAYALAKQQDGDDPKRVLLHKYLAVLRNKGTLQSTELNEVLELDRHSTNVNVLLLTAKIKKQLDLPPGYTVLSTPA